jgi:hypothetical protein
VSARNRNNFWYGLDHIYATCANTVRATARAKLVVSSFMPPMVFVRAEQRHLNDRVAFRAAGHARLWLRAFAATSHSRRKIKAWAAGSRVRFRFILPATASCWCLALRLPSWRHPCRAGAVLDRGERVSGFSDLESIVLVSAIRFFPKRLMKSASFEAKAGNRLTRAVSVTDAMSMRLLRLTFVFARWINHWTRAGERPGRVG